MASQVPGPCAGRGFLLQLNVTRPVGQALTFTQAGHPWVGSRESKLFNPVQKKDKRLKGNAFHESLKSNSNNCFAIGLRSRFCMCIRSWHPKGKNGKGEQRVEADCLSIIGWTR